MFHEYHPTVVHDLHEAIALLQTWNGTGPYNPNLDPIATTAWLTMSFHEVQTLTALGMPGVWTWDFGEGFGQHYLDSVAMNHNSLGRGYETFGNTTAETVDRVLGRGATSAASGTGRCRRRPRFRWSMRDNVNYQQTAALAASSTSPREREGDAAATSTARAWNSWRKGVEGPPFAFVIPADQGDPPASRRWSTGCWRSASRCRARTPRSRCRKALSPRAATSSSLDQPYRNYAVDLLSPQVFPEDSKVEPYDDVSWALPVALSPAGGARSQILRCKTAAATLLTEPAAGARPRRGRRPGLPAQGHAARSRCSPRATG